MAKFVTFDNNLGTYHFRAIFPQSATKAEIETAVEKKLKQWIRKRGLDKNIDMPPRYLIKRWIKTRTMKEGSFYEPDSNSGGHWDD